MIMLEIVVLVSEIADPVAAQPEVWALSTRTQYRRFGSHLRRTYLLWSVCIALSCVRRGLATGPSLVRGVLPSVEGD
jgi:hypothetical protein